MSGPGPAGPVDFLLTGAGQLVTCDPALGEGRWGWSSGEWWRPPRAGSSTPGPRPACPAWRWPPARPGRRRRAGGGPRAGRRPHPPGVRRGPGGRVRGPAARGRLRGGAGRRGGINRTVRETRAATDDELEASAAGRLATALANGTTTLEAKSGYGLTVDDERRSLEVLAEVAARSPVEVVPTFLGAHLIPEEYAGDRGGYLDLVEQEMLPACAPWPSSWTPSATRGPDGGGVAAGAGGRRPPRPGRQAPRQRARLDRRGRPGRRARLHSADHLLFCDRQEAKALADAGTVAVLLPGTSFLLRTGRAAPVQVLREARVTLALGTDCNPGPVTASRCS